MYGFTESLNISVAAAIILQDLTRRLRNSNMNWQLNDLEKEVLYYKWVRQTIKNVDKIEDYFYKNLKE